MILMYHKVAPMARTYWWVSTDAFYRQMAALRSYRVVSLDDYDPADPDQAVISFDGVYANVAEYAAPILQHFGYPFELFVVGDCIGRSNDFDQHVEPPCDFASLAQLEALAAAGGRLQWHTRTHARLDGLDDTKLKRELDVPERLRSEFGPAHFRWFAYPHGCHDARVVDAVRSRFHGALSVVDGADGDRWQLNRTTAHEGSNFFRGRVSIIVANYNYGRFLPEAMHSVLQQTTPPDEVLIIDDASTDGSQEIVRRYANVAKIELNATNLGIVENFRKAVSLTTGDYIAILGADNRLRCDFVERCRTALDNRPDAAVAYTDMMLFGPRASLLAKQVGADFVAESANEGWSLYHWRFPAEDDPRWTDFQTTQNFIHGSSMYRRADYDRAGGYRSSQHPEDWHLFRRMLASGRAAVQVAAPVLEYRQHGGRQANTVLTLEYDVAFWRNRATALERALEHALGNPPMPIAFLGPGFAHDDGGCRFMGAAAELTISRRELGADSVRIDFNLYRHENEKYAVLPISVAVLIDGVAVGTAAFDGATRKLPFSFEIAEVRTDFTLRLVSDARPLDESLIDQVLIFGDLRIAAIAGAMPALDERSDRQLCATAG